MSSDSTASTRNGELSDKENPFTQFYGQLLHQGNMLADYERTGTYQRAFLENRANFEGKVVLDVGTGTGILSFFALQAGAARVYAVDASDSVFVAKKLAETNGYADKMTVIKGKIEEVELPEKVDVIISEPIGFLLVHERMLESFVAARDRFLKPDGLMMPTTGSIVFCPFTDDALYRENCAKAAFWENKNFYGLDLSSIVTHACDEFFSQAIVGFADPACLISRHLTVQTIDFSDIEKEDLLDFTIPIEFVVDRTVIMHGLCGWFDIDFIGSEKKIVLSTAPECPGTHWYQCKLMLREPIAVNRGQTVCGKLHFVANDSFSYFIDMEVQIKGTNVVSHNRINLKDQHYAYLQPS